MESDVKELLKNVMMAEEYLKKAGSTMLSKFNDNVPNLSHEAIKAFCKSLDEISFQTDGVKSFVRVAVLKQIVQPEG
jgi:hypothetical protein